MKDFKRFFQIALTLIFVLGWSPLFAGNSFDHKPWHEVLRAVVSKEGFVNYDKLKGNPEKLDAYLKEAARVSPRNKPELFSSREEEMVYWLQVYNALAMKNVLNFPGLKKTSDKKLRFFVFTKFNVGGEKYSLRSLENKVIRAQYKDARAHFFLNCASYSCPQLYREPLNVRKLDEQLNRFSRNFINDTKHVQFDPQSGILKLSMILKWYQKDFLDAMKDVSGGKKEKIVAYLNQFREIEIPISGVKKIKYIPYNWTVNDIKNL